MKRFSIVALVILLALLGACSADSSDTPAELVHIRLPMGYIPDPQYAPLYVADQKGYFAAEGLEVEFDYSYETDGIALLGAGELHFSLGSGEQVIMARAKGLPIVYAMQWFQEFPVAVMAKAESGIETPADLAGRQIGIPGLFGASYVGFEGLLNAQGMRDDDLELVEIGFTQAEALAQEQVEAVVVYVNNEPVRLGLQGESINVIPVAEYTNLVANGLLTNEKTVEENPELVEGMIRAMLKGLRDTLADPDAAFEICKDYVEGIAATPETATAQRAVLEASLDLWRAPKLGISNAEAWDITQQVLLTIDFIQEPIDLSKAWTNRFVEAAGVE